MSATDIYAMTAEEPANAQAKIEQRFENDQFLSAFDREQVAFELDRIRALRGVAAEGRDKSKWNFISKSRVTMPLEDFDASALNDVEVTRTAKSITVKIGDLVTLSRDTKVAYQFVSIDAWNWNWPDRADLAVSFSKRQPSPKADPYGNAPLASATAAIPA